MSVGEDDLEQLAGEYVLGTLPSEARLELEQRLPHDASLRAAVEGWESRLHPLTAMAAPVDVPASLWAGIEERLDVVRQLPPQGHAELGQAQAQAPPESVTAMSPKTTRPGADAPDARARSGVPRWWHSLALWRGLAATGFAVAMLALWLPRPAAPPVTPQYVVVLVAPGSPTPGWVVHAGPSHNLELVPLAPMTVPESRALQFWTKADTWAGPVSLGLVRPGEVLRVPVDHLPPLQPNQLFEITLEPENGSPIGRPTGPILYIGRAVRLHS
jgi:anti-sigma-K factor RskA